MRVSAAITVALTALLTLSLFGAVAATPTASVSTPEYEQTDVVADRSPQPLERALLSNQPMDSTDQSSKPSLSAAQSSNSLGEPDPKQVIRIAVRDNGDVRWTVESRFLLTDQNDTADFREYAENVTSGQRDVAYDLEQFENFREMAKQTTGREMAIEADQWNEPRIIESPDDADLSDETIANDEDVRIGVLSYSFTWTNFATVDDDRIYFGDAFQTASGTWIGVSDGQRLVIETPSDFALETPTRLTWNGPYEFDDSELDIVFVRTGDSLLSMPGWLIGGLVVIVGLGAGGYLLARRDDPTELLIPTDRLPSLDGIEIGTRSTDDEDPATAASTPSNSAAGPRPDSDAVAAPTDSATGRSGTSLEFEEPDDDDIDPELLSDEERVLRLLKQNGGRMKQASIVSETGWSNAKVSQLLSKMDDDDEIAKLRIGRENLITLPGVDPTELD